MNKRLYEVNKIDTPLPDNALVAATPQTTRAYSLSEYRKALFSVKLRNIAVTDEDLTFSVLEASDIAAATARNIGNAATTPNIEFERVAAGCIANASIVQLTMADPTVADVITINGVEFTAAAAEDLPNRVYDQSGTTTEQATSLTAAINMHLPELIATSDAAVITIQSREPGAETITVTGITDATDVVPVTVEVVGNIEIDASALSDGFDRVCGRILPGDPAAAITCDISLVRGNGRYEPVGQQEGGSAFS